MRVDENGEIMMIMIRTPYNYDTDRVSLETGTECLDESKTRQEHKDEVDINQIVERFGITGEMPQSVNMPTTADFTNAVTDYQTAMNMVVEARESFMTLPANARARFRNDPQEFMEFMQDPDKLDEAVKLGLVTKRPEEKPPEKKAEEPPKTDTTKT